MSSRRNPSSRAGTSPDARSGPKGRRWSSRTRGDGTVYLVGAGPGDPELVTVRGQRLIRSADVLVYDRLVHPDLVDEAPVAADRYFVGKAPERHQVTQAEINALLVTEARLGGNVVRLKGGDPFVFARGGEEARRLRQEEVSFEIVPGVTSATSVPAFAGIPLTDRRLSSGFTVVTGHTCREEGSGIDWRSLARSSTLVVLMGLGRLPRIAEMLIEHGRAPETPAAVIEAGTTRDQRVVTGPLAKIGERSRKLDPPATIVIGEVAELGRELDWFDAGPVQQHGDASSPFPITEPMEGSARGDNLQEVPLSELVLAASS